MKITLKIKRFDPENSRAPRFQTYEVEANPTDRLLDALMEVKRSIDPSLGFRKSCAHGVCGSDAMVINGKERLACKTLIQEVAEKEGETITIEPLRTLPVQKDLMVDQDPFFRNYRKVKPYLITEQKPPRKERRQSPVERKAIEDSTKCILCAACFSACPIKLEKNPDFLGPAAVVQAARFIDDTRDKGFEERLPELNNPDGIWPCENRFECTRVCPRNILVTKLINSTKKKISDFKKSLE
jgi:succinate dehydrogenase / fumarate reductase iron-sulfur subunit